MASISCKTAAKSPSTTKTPAAETPATTERALTAAPQTVTAQIKMPTRLPLRTRIAAPAEELVREPVSPIYSSTGSHFAADGRHSARRYRVVHAASGFRSPGSGLSDYPGRHVLSRSKSRRHGLRCNRAARASVRRSARSEPDDFHQLRRKLGDCPSILARPEHRRRRARSASVY